MFNFPWSNFHELNLDWILSVVKEAKEVFDDGRSDIDYAVSTADEAKEIATQAAEATIPDNSISTVKIQNGAVTSAKLANNSVTTANIVDRTIIGNDIAENTIESYNIKNGTIIGADIANNTIQEANLLNGCVGNSKIADNAVTSAKIADGGVSYAKLATNAKPTSGSNYCKFPNGFLVQWGHETIPAGSVYVSKVFDPPFTNGNYELVVSAAYGSNGREIIATYGAKTSTGVTFYVPSALQSDQVVSWIAVGFSE